MFQRGTPLRRAVRYAACLPIALCGVAVLAGCGSGHELTTQQVNGAVSGNQAWGMDSEQTQLGMIAPGSAFIPGPRRDITLLSARLIPLKGYRLPKLAGVAVVRGCFNAGSNYSVFPSQAWPPVVDLIGTRTAPVTALPGDTVRTGGTRCIPLVIYGVRSRTPGPYALAGLRITFRAGGHTGSIASYDDGLVAWFYQSGQPNQAQFTRLFNAAARAQNALASS
jgi:hypothetical protein